VMWGFLGIFFLALILVIVFEPVYLFILKKIKKSSWASIVTTLVIVLVMVVPLGIFVSLAVQQAMEVVADLSHQITTRAWLQNSAIDTINYYVPGLVDQLEIFLANQQNQVINMAQSFTKGLGDVVTKGVIPALTGGAKAILDTFIFIMMMAYLFPVKGKIFKKLAQISPLDPKHHQQFVQRFEGVVTATIQSTLLVASAQGILGGLMLVILGVNAAALWGFMMGMASFVPFGAGIVWWPVGIGLLLSGQWIQGIIWIIYCLTVVSTVDNIIRSKVLSSGDSDIPELVTFMAILGGLQVFGFMGLFLGPIIAGLFLTALDVYTQDK
jgi:predicted PurR-regulated permease PerM